MKMSTQFTIFFVAFNALAAVVLGMGVAAELGISAETGSPAAIEQAGQSQDVRMGNSVGGTLFGMYNVLTQQAAALFYTVAPGMAMLRNFLPNLWVDVFLSPLATLIATKDIIAFARGVDL
jgi:hypothetical protein